MVAPASVRTLGGPRRRRRLYGRIIVTRTTVVPEPPRRVSRVSEPRTLLSRLPFQPRALHSHAPSSALVRNERGGERSMSDTDFGSSEKVPAGEQGSQQRSASVQSVRYQRNVSDVTKQTRIVSYRYCTHDRRTRKMSPCRDHSVSGRKFGGVGIAVCVHSRGFESSCFFLFSAHKARTRRERMPEASTGNDVLARGERKKKLPQ